ncbi:MAG: type II toxin-antitoxin system prevent-host-death family antitoxin [Acidimicrobiia bacterium]|nr:type II toxin-antitoxin system prevent-host-death family antitoxin [Acidimicrobiia bacterium]
MDVTVSSLRAHLSDWLARVQAGAEVVVTDRGTPVARIVGVSAPTLLDQLEKDGQISRAKSSTRPTATARTRTRSKHSVADLVSRQRD